MTRWRVVYLAKQDAAIARHKAHYDALRQRVCIGKVADVRIDRPIQLGDIINSVRF